MTSQLQVASSAETKSAGRARLPGVLPAALVTLLSAAGVSGGLMSESFDVAQPDREGGLATAELAEVAAQDIDAALTTLDATAAYQEQFRRSADKCAVPLAWVAVVPTAGQNGGTVRFQSGQYFSPDFHLSGAAVRVAIPFPAPIQDGHGILTVFHSGGNLTISLRPAWHLPASETRVAHDVTWAPVQPCKRSNG